MEKNTISSNKPEITYTKTGQMYNTALFSYSSTRVELILPQEVQELKNVELGADQDRQINDDRPIKEIQK